MRKAFSYQLLTFRDSNFGAMIELKSVIVRAVFVTFSIISDPDRRNSMIELLLSPILCSLGEKNSTNSVFISYSILCGKVTSYFYVFLMEIELMIINLGSYADCKAVSRIFQNNRDGIF